MKLLHPLIGFSLLTLWASTSQADISLKNKQYLPPPIQELPIKDNHYNTQKSNPLPLRETPVADIHHIEHFNVASGFPLIHSHLDASYLSYPQYGISNFPSPHYLPSIIQVQEYSGVPIQNILTPQLYQTAHKFGPDYLPPLQINFYNADSLKSSEYLPPQQHGADYLPSHQLSSHSHKHFEQNAPIESKHNLAHTEAIFKPTPQVKSTEYLPPNQLAQSQQVPYRGPKYLPPQSNLINLDYTPAPQGNSVQQNKPNVPFKGPVYLPPPVDSKVESNNSPKNVEYLPPQQSDIDGSDYFTPQATHVQQQQVLPLPPGYDFDKPENAEQAIEELHKLPEESVKSQNPVAGITLPVNTFQPPKLEETTSNIKSIKDHFQKTAHSIHTREGLQRDQSHQSKYYQNYHDQKYLETDKNYYSQVINQLENKQISQTFKSSNSIQRVTEPPLLFKGPDSNAPDYLPPTTGAQTSTGPIITPQTLKNPEYLPPTYESQMFKGPAADYLPPTTSGSKSYNDNEYLPPVELKGRDFLPPASGQQSDHAPQQTHIKSSDYLPPNGSTSNQLNTNIMYPSSMYMTNVKPNVRYGMRMSLAEYGVSTATESSRLSSMYHKLTSKAQYYAPTMSYVHNEFRNQTSTKYTHDKYRSAPALSPEAVRALQFLVPKELRPASMQQPPKPIKSNIRTLQIVNANAVKTLKLLESLDHTGAKTIKILDSLDEEPTGEHRIVKIVNGSDDQNVQTIKIFNDHPDDTPSTNGATAVGENK